MGDLCTGTMFELSNSELHITEANASDWYAFHSDLNGFYDRLQTLVDDSKTPDPTPFEYEQPIYGVRVGKSGRQFA